MCDPDWCVHQSDVQDQWDNKHTHTHIMPVDVAVPVIAVYYKVLQSRRVFYRSVVVRYNNLMFLLNSSSSKDLELKSGGKYPRARWAEYISARWKYIFAPSLIE